MSVTYLSLPFWTSVTVLYKDMDGNHYGSYSITIIIPRITTAILDVGNLTLPAILDISDGSL